MKKKEDMKNNNVNEIIAQEREKSSDLIQKKARIFIFLWVCFNIPRVKKKNILRRVIALTIIPTEAKISDIRLKKKNSSCLGKRKTISLVRHDFYFKYICRNF